MACEHEDHRELLEPWGDLLVPWSDLGTAATDTDGVRADRHPVPCGRHVFHGAHAAERAIRHAAGCLACSTAARAAGATGEEGPMPGTELVRRSLAGDVCDVLTVYSRNVKGEYVDSNAAQRQVIRLVSMIARLEVALAHETNRSAGDQYASGHKVLGRYVAPVAPTLEA